MHLGEITDNNNITSEVSKARSSFLCIFNLTLSRVQTTLQGPEAAIPESQHGSVATLSCKVSGPSVK